MDIMTCFVHGRGIIGAEASAIRCLTGNASISLTGNGYIDDFKKENLSERVGKWVKTPDLTKPIWEGKYVIPADK